MDSSVFNPRLGSIMRLEPVVVIRAKRFKHSNTANHTVYGVEPYWLIHQICFTDVAWQDTSANI